MECENRRLEWTKNKKRIYYVGNIAFMDQFHKCFDPRLRNGKSRFSHNIFKRSRPRRIRLGPNRTPRALFGLPSCRTWSVLPPWNRDGSNRFASPLCARHSQIKTRIDCLLSFFINAIYSNCPAPIFIRIVIFSFYVCYDLRRHFQTWCKPLFLMCISELDKKST